MKKPPPMMNRRDTLLAMLGAGAAGFTIRARAHPAPDRERARDVLSTPAASAADVDQALRADLARLGARAYSDEGILVFLACEALVPPQPSPAAASTPLSHHFAAELRKNGEAWLRVYPNAPATDISKLIELLAERDFSRSGR